MSYTTELGALAVKNASFFGYKPGLVHVVGNHVGLSPEIGYPEAVYNVVGHQGEIDAFVYRNVKLVSRRYIQLGITETPTTTGEQLHLRSPIRYRDPHPQQYRK